MFLRALRVPPAPERPPKLWYTRTFHTPLQRSPRGCERGLQNLRPSSPLHRQHAERHVRTQSRGCTDTSCVSILIKVNVNVSRICTTSQPALSKHFARYLIKTSPSLGRAVSTSAYLAAFFSNSLALGIDKGIHFLSNHPYGKTY